MTNKEKARLQREIVDSLPDKPHGRLHIAPRVGKTKIVIDLIKRDKPNSILWVTPSAESVERDIPQQFSKWSAKRYLKRLTPVTWTSLNTITGDFDLIVLDEEQYITENNSENLLNGFLRSKHIISMTGTPTKVEEKISIYKELNLEVLHSLTINDAVDMGALSNYEITVLMLEPEAEKLREYHRIQKQIDSKSLGTYSFEEGLIRLSGHLNGQLEVRLKEKSEDKDVNYLVGKQGNVGYLITSKEEPSTYGKMTLMNREYVLKDGVFGDPVPSFLYQRRAFALGDSQLKTKVARELLNSLKGRNICFCQSQNQANILPGGTYHGNTDNRDLLFFQSEELDVLCMVNSGGVGFTFRNISNLILIQATNDNNGSSSQKLARTLLQQPNYMANLLVLCVKGTQDEKWVERTLSRFNQDKIKYVNHEDYRKSKTDLE